MAIETSYWLIMMKCSPEDSTFIFDWIFNNKLVGKEDRDKILDKLDIRSNRTNSRTSSISGQTGPFILELLEAYLGYVDNDGILAHLILRDIDIFGILIMEI